MQHLDLEQQLRLRQTQQTTSLSTSAVPPLSYLHSTYHAAAKDVIVFFAGLPVVTAVLFVAVALLARSKSFANLAKLMKENHHRTNAGLIVANTTPTTFSLCMAAWMILLALQTVCNVLRGVAQQHYRSVQHTNASALADLSVLHTLPMEEVSPQPIWGLSANMTALYPSLLRWSMTPTAFVFAAQYAGMVCMWCYVFFAGHPLEAGVFGALVAFFPNFYEALLLNGNEPDRWPVWVTLVSFLLSLACLWAFGAPVVRREYRELKREMQGHTAEALYKDRPELRELRARAGHLPKKPKQK
ncbi:hypothetical protein ABB37_08568 [Leptomonas pyrrhocoris]|uniref:Uncharacterized protein n=1 Tax=Leptomonas pyrrhocoris TaxID=157538 RepID=A0A0M9FSQ8_LEPPY|nr:hypothetical protein ABB37_08568 [Leptomonas pyrrhocoris]KPA75263.1 hypothetical protein ABB37_08568 [Leptomonas pyrrhocoris]|eukprot:XP_015653702.1 hypothetical protein ABB37_08568 [Leptomonas pyrrhocoris]